MKIAGYILIFILTCSTVLPVLGRTQTKVTTQCCKKKSSCSKKASQKGKKEKDCQGEGCNPFMACSNYNLFLLAKAFHSNHIVLIQKKQKIAIVNDNRISSRLSDCWHPPNC